MPIRALHRSPLARARGWPYLLPGLAYVGLMFAYPVYELVRMSLSDVNVSNFVSGAWKYVGLANFRNLPSLPGWGQMVRNTGVFLVGSIIPQLVIGGVLAVALGRRSRLRRVARSFVLIPWLFPVVGTATVFLWMFQAPGGLFDSLFQSLGIAHGTTYFLDEPNDALIVIVLINVWIGIPFYYLVIQSGLQTIPVDLHETATVDGASWLQELVRVTIPLLRDTLLTVVVLGVIGTMNVYAFVWIVTQGGPADATMLPGLFAYQLAFTNYNYGAGAAMMVLIVALLLVVGVAYVAFTRQSRKGLVGRGSSRPAVTTVRLSSSLSQANQAGAE